MLRRALDIATRAGILAAAVGVVAVIGLTYWITPDPTDHL